MTALPEGIVSIHGKPYQTVGFRVNKFREDHPDWTIETQLISEDDIKVVMKALIYSNKAAPVLEEYEPHLLATGYAEEVRASSKINETSALENAETSAIGRALAALGYAGTEYASADEVANAISAQTDFPHIQHMEAVRKWWNSLHAIKGFLGELPPKVDAAREAFKEIDVETQKILWRAPTKGGVFTTQERKLLLEGQA
jgi:hypothetical protein